MLPLGTDRLTIRMMRAHDLPTVVAYRNDPDIARYQDWELPHSEESARQGMERQAALDGPTDGRWVSLAVEHHGEVIGDVAVELRGDGTLSTLGYTFAAQHHGKGLATEAVAAVVDALCAQGVHRFVATLDPENTPSMRVLEAVGFTFESLARSAELIRGEWVDDLRYSLLAADRAAWVARPSTPSASVELVEITPDDAYLWGRLATHYSQQRFVAPMLASFTDALFPEAIDGGPVTPWLRGVLADGERAGFVMMAVANEFQSYPYLWRLLIDRMHQRRGIGQRIIDLLAEQLRADGHVTLVTSYEEGAGGPAPFYHRMGFVPTGNLIDGEVETVLTLA